jgi:hypothetical protein
MKRLLLPASALVLVVTACGAGIRSAPRVTEVAARPASVPPTIAGRKQAARREAKALLREFVPPPGARRVWKAPTAYGGAALRQTAPLIGETVDAYRVLKVRSPLAAVVAFVKAHPPPGPAYEQSAVGIGAIQPWTTLMLSWPRGPYPIRGLAVTAIGVRTGTLVGVTATVVWVYPRPPTEKVPSGVSEIVVRTPKTSVTVNDPETVALLVRRFDGLPVSPPGVVLFCPIEPPASEDVTLSFDDAGGAALAQATVPPIPGEICDPMKFTIGGQAQTPLIDHRRGETFLHLLRRLLGL